MSTEQEKTEKEKKKEEKKRGEPAKEKHFPLFPSLFEPSIFLKWSYYFYVSPANALCHQREPVGGVCWLRVWIEAAVNLSMLYQYRNSTRIKRKNTSFTFVFSIVICWSPNRQQSFCTTLSLSWSSTRGLLCITQQREREKRYVNKNGVITPWQDSGDRSTSLPNRDERWRQIRQLTWHVSLLVNKKETTRNFF